ncbi:MAG: diguanylate cyclase [Actinomycetota bacterium]|nr:diguanylate cyclase [Actinomycetota bacterium]
MNNKTIRKTVSIRALLILIFISIMVVTIGLIGYIVFSNWVASVNQTVTHMAENMNSNIFNQVDDFINTPLHINEVNHDFIEQGIVDLNHEAEREKFFVSVLSNHSDGVYSFSFGTETGEYYGARRNSGNIIEIMKNNAETGGNSWYYEVNEDMTAGQRVVEAGKFDPRTRDWYKAAKEQQGPVFSPIYKHFVMDDLTVSAAYPIYTQKGQLKGVLGTHIILSNIDGYLEEIVKDVHGYALIAELDSKQLVANSLGMANFNTLEDGTIDRVTIDQINIPAMVEAYGQYANNGENNFILDYDREQLHINLIEYHKNGLDWMIITAVPQSLFTAGIIGNIRLALILAVASILAAILAYLLITNKLLKPVNELIATTQKFSQGDLSQRAPVARNDEVGKLSRSFNFMADRLSYLVGNLEKKVKERTEKLELANSELEANEEKLELILNSTAEAIYGIDMKGNCTFCNASGIKILGYKNQEELIGKNMHYQIHRYRRDGSAMPISECKIVEAIKAGKGTHVDDEVFWKADGTSFDVEYYSYPQYKERKIVGAVITFWDITESKKIQEHIKYISQHDSLTGLYNRAFFEQQLKENDHEGNLPLTIIFGDINGLKLTNDIFGHEAGDKLLKKSTEILKNACRDQDIVARMGGDEFAILLTNTDGKEAEKIISRIKNEFNKERTYAVRGSISIGYETKTGAHQDIDSIVKDAEVKMYNQKTLHREDIDRGMVDTIIETLQERNPREKLHSQSVSHLCQAIGQEMELPDTEVRKLKEAGLLHDIGKIALSRELLNLNEDMLSGEQKMHWQQHPAIGYRILNLSNRTLDLAEGVLSHHENWDGSGFPKGLKGKEIPMIARIIGVAEAYDAMTNKLRPKPMSSGEALKEIKKAAGIKFDPEIVDILFKLVKA